MDWFARFMAYAQGCLSQPLGAPECNALWGALFLTAFCVVGIVALRLIYRVNAEEENRIIEDIIKGRHTRTAPSSESHRRNDRADASGYLSTRGRQHNKPDSTSDALR